MTPNKLIFGLIITCIFSSIAFAQEVSVVLKNSKVIVGRIVEEKPDYIIINHELGQIKVDRLNIDRITYHPFMELGNEEETISGAGKINTQFTFSIKDPVVVYLRNGNAVSGLLLAKSINMIMVQTESGNLTIPKADVQRIEYVSSEYAERGEIVIANLHSGQRFEGNIYFEDSKELTLDTEIGRLTLPKNKLRSLEYTGKTGIGKLTIAEQYQKAIVNKRSILPRYDVFDISYSTKFGTNYGPGFGLGYQSRFRIAEFEGLDLSVPVGLSLIYFALNEDNLIKANPSLNATLKGGAFVATFGAGGQLNIYPQTAAFYDFYVAPSLEAYYIYTKLDQEYPQFPQFNIGESTSDLKFGLGVRFGVEFLFDPFRLGVHYNTHYIFGSDGFNQFSLTFVKPLF